MPGSFRLRVRMLSGLATAAVLGAGSAGPARAQTPGVLRVTIIPSTSPTEISRRFTPLGRYLERELDMAVEWIPSADYDAVVQAMVDRKVDLALLGGFTFVQANARSRGKIIPLVQRDRDANYRSVFIARAGSGIQRLDQLKGRSFSFGPASSTSGHLMPRAALLAARIRPETDLRSVQYASGHDATVAAVAGSKVDAGVLHLTAWERLVGDGKVDPAAVRVFFTTAPYHDANWSVHADLPAPTREAIKAAFLRLDVSSPDGREILELQGATRYLPTRVENYNGIKAAAENAGLLK